MSGAHEAARASEAPGRTPPDVALYAAAILAAALLLFLIQPMVGKRILPWFGGVPAVWAVCLAFYQTALLAGYLYADLLARRARPRAQLIVHAVACAAAVAAPSVLPAEPDAAAGGAPLARIVLLLVAHVALPFTVLAATGPLVQHWFARRHPARSPYPLYAVSNLGSLLALLAYPFLLEPRVPLTTLGRIWSGSYALAVLAVLACAALALRAPAPPHAAPAASPDAGPGSDRGHPLLWLGLSAGGVVLLMGVTNALCLDIASIPFLWILPLALYLASFIACFGRSRPWARAPWAVLALLMWFLPELASELSSEGWSLRGNLVGQIGRFGLLLLAGCMALHGELHRLRPHASRLTTYYLCISTGGALGGLAVGIVAPLVFDDYHELPMGLRLAAGLVLAAYIGDPGTRLGGKGARWQAAVFALFAVLAVLVPGAARHQRDPAVLLQERSFFGVLRVKDDADGDPPRRELSHGTTVHGYELLDTPGRPTSYYGVRTGIGTLLTDAALAPDRRVGVVGLGAGTLAAYGRPGDLYRFFEIDEAVVRTAHAHFAYLGRSDADVEIVVGDGRIALAEEEARGAPPFDILVIDAYSSDAVPLHLLTREAFALYERRLAPGGVLAVHVSSATFLLGPVVARAGREVGLEAIVYENPRDDAAASWRAIWTLLARDGTRLDALVRATNASGPAGASSPGSDGVRRPAAAELARAPLWTDDFSHLLGALRPRR